PDSHPEGPDAGEPARRLTKNRWSDPRMLTGMLLVALAVAGGAGIVEASDDTTAVWALQVDVRAGEQAEVGDLRLVRAHLGSASTEPYLTGSKEALATLLGSRVFAHDIAAGELLARSALVPAKADRRNELPLRVGAGAMPVDLRAGERVDVWAAPTRQADGGAGAAVRVLEGVQVTDVHASSAALGQSSAHVVLVALDSSAGDELDTVLARISGAALTLVRVRTREAP